MTRRDANPGSQLLIIRNDSVEINEARETREGSGEIQGASILPLLAGQLERCRLRIPPKCSPSASLRVIRGQPFRIVPDM
jgi:hypothetical protein